MNIEKAIKAQSELLIHVAERLLMLQVAFEARLHQEIGKDGEEHDEHFEMRQEMYVQDSATTTDLIRTLRTVLSQ
jgi:hypothetical protein